MMNSKDFPFCTLCCSFFTRPPNPMAAPGARWGAKLARVRPERCLPFPRPRSAAAVLLACACGVRLAVKRELLQPTERGSARIVAAPRTPLVELMRGPKPRRWLMTLFEVKFCRHRSLKQLNATRPSFPPGGRQCSTAALERRRDGTPPLRVEAQKKPPESGVPVALRRRPRKCLTTQQKQEPSCPGKKRQVTAVHATPRSTAPPRAYGARPAPGAHRALPPPPPPGLPPPLTLTAAVAHSSAPTAADTGTGATPLRAGASR